MDAPSPAPSPAGHGPGAASDNAAKSGPAGPNIGQKIWTHSQPTLERVWTFLRVWMPWLATPDLRNRQVVFPSKPYLKDGCWQISLPKQCLACGKEEGIQARAFDRAIRHFETPAAFVGASLGAFFIFFLLGVYFLWPLLLLLALLSLLGNVALYVKSWPEEVELTTYSCTEHSEGLQCPDLIASDDKLCVVVPTATLAEATRLQIRAERAARQGAGNQDRGGKAASGAAPRPEPARQEPARRAPPESIPLDDGPAAGGPSSAEQLPRRGELPPIKLDE